MKRRALAVLAVGAAVASLAVTASAAAPTAWNHDPGSAIGPTHWGTLDPAFAQCETGTNQSPVDMSGVVKGAGGRPCSSGTPTTSWSWRTPDM